MRHIPSRAGLRSGHGRFKALLTGQALCRRWQCFEHVAWIASLRKTSTHTASSAGKAIAATAPACHATPRLLCALEPLNEFS